MANLPPLKISHSFRAVVLDLQILKMKLERYWDVLVIHKVADF